MLAAEHQRQLDAIHELMGDWIVQNPGGTLRELSAHFGYSVSWSVMVINSNMFQAYMARRLGSVDVPVLREAAEFARKAHKS
jgi:hypothetical protein